MLDMSLSSVPPESHSDDWAWGEREILVTNLLLTDQQVIAYLSDGERETAPQRLLAAIELGVMALSLVGPSRDISYLTARVSEIPRSVAERLEQELTTEEGGVLAPVRAVVDEVAEILEDRLDPKNANSTLAQALERLKYLTDEGDPRSIPRRLRETIKKITEDGGDFEQLIGRKFEAVLRAAREGLAAEGATADGALEHSKTFEREVFEDLQAAFAGSGALVTHVGGDNDSGDIEVAFGEDFDATGETSSDARTLKILVEAKDWRGQPRAGVDDKKGKHTRREVENEIKKGFESRQPDGVVLVVPGPGGLKPRDVTTFSQGEIAERGPWIVAFRADLIEAVRYMRVKTLYLRFREASADDVLDVRSARIHVQNIKRQLARFTQFTRQLNVIDAASMSLRDLKSEISARLEAEADDLRRLLGAPRDGTNGEGGPVTQSAGSELEHSSDDDESDDEADAEDLEETQPLDLNRFYRVPCRACGEGIERSGSRGHPPVYHEECRPR